MIEVQRGAFKRPNTKILVIAGAVAFVVVAGVAAWFGWQYFNLKNNPDAEDKALASRLVKDVGQLFMLPDEEPTVAQVQDKEKLKDQKFFKRAENGDYILIYAKEEIALLYREKDRKLVWVGPITINDNKTPQGTEKK